MYIDARSRRACGLCVLATCFQPVRDVHTAAHACLSLPLAASPSNGTCRHYTRSLRRYRFPCCGMLFACDERHAEARVPAKVCFVFVSVRVGVRVRLWCVQRVVSWRLVAGLRSS